MSGIILISGTNRPGSNTRKVAACVEGIYKSLGVKIQLVDLAEMPPEIFSPTSYAAKPAGFSRFAEAVLGADGLAVVTPEYNGSFPGVLKYFIDMLPFPESLQQRPVCLVGISAGIWGAFRSVEQLQSIFVYRNAYVYPERVFAPGIGGMVNEGGKFTNKEIETRLQTQAAGFVKFVETLRGTKLR